MAGLPEKKIFWYPKKNLDAVTNFVFLWTTFCSQLRIGKLYLVTFLECKPFLVLWERTCLKKSCFPGYFWHSLFPLDIWWFDRKSFFRVRRGLRTSAHPKKTFPVSPPNVLREKFMSKKSWKVAFLQARPFSRPKKSLHPSKVTRTDHSCLTTKCPTGKVHVKKNPGK